MILVGILFLLTKLFNVAITDNIFNFFTASFSRLYEIGCYHILFPYLRTLISVAYFR